MKGDKKKLPTDVVFYSYLKLADGCIAEKKLQEKVHVECRKFTTLNDKWSLQENCNFVGWLACYKGKKQGF